jgi:hypothetical protein
MFHRFRCYAAPMSQSAHIDGCSLVILRSRRQFFRAGFEIVESGVLSYDGKVLELESVDGSSRRIVTEVEQSQIALVTEKSAIPECAGYRLFILLRD